MENEKICEQPIPELVKFSNLYSNINSNILWVLTPQECKQLGSMSSKELTEFTAKMDRAKNPNKSFKEALEFTITTGTLLYSLMNGKEVNTVELSKIIGVSDVSIGRWINGSTNITKGNLNKLAKYFNVSVNYLMGLDSRPSEQQEQEQMFLIDFIKKQLKKYWISNLEKEILKECGYYLIDPYLNDEYYKEKAQLAQITENQIINKNEWLTWVYTIGYFEAFPSKIALIKTSELKKMNVYYWDNNNPIEYSKEIEKKAQYVDFEKLKCIIEDRKSMLAFNFEKSLDSIK